MLYSYILSIELLYKTVSNFSTIFVENFKPIFFYKPFFKKQLNMRYIQGFYNPKNGFFFYLSGFSDKTIFLKTCRFIFFKFFFFKICSNFFSFFIKNTKISRPYLIYSFFFKTIGFLINNSFFLKNYTYFFKKNYSYFINFGKVRLKWVVLSCNDTINLYNNSFFLYYFFNKILFNWRSYNTVYKKNNLSGMFFYRSFSLYTYYLDIRSSMFIVGFFKNNSFFFNYLNFNTFSSYGWKLLN